MRPVGLSVLVLVWWVGLGPGPLAAQSCDDRAASLDAAVQGADLTLADALLTEALPECPRHPAVLAQGASLRFVQGRHAEAEALVTRYLAEEPGAGAAWGLELLGTLRYLRGDVPAALEAWNRLDRPRLREIAVAVADQEGAVPPGAVGLSSGELITGERLQRGARRLQDLPAVQAARLSLRPLPGAEADLVGAVLLHDPHPFGWIHLPAHGVRALRGEARLAAAGLPGVGPGAGRTGGWTGWALELLREGELRTGVLRWSHPSPRGGSVVRWEVGGTRGRWLDPAAGSLEGAVRDEERWTVSSTFLHRPWAPVRLGVSAGWAHRRSVPPGPVAGLGVELDPGPWRLGLRVDVGRSGRAWARIDTELRRTFRPSSGWELEPRIGLVALSSDAPPDIQPRFGADRSATHLMRGGRAVNREGVVRPLVAGPTWQSGGFELRRFGQGAVTRAVGAALFLDALRGSGSTEPMIHAGLGLRLRPGSDTDASVAVGSEPERGLRLDLARDLGDGGWRLSAGWSP